MKWQWQEEQREGGGGRLKIERPSNVRRETELS